VLVPRLAVGTDQQVEEVNLSSLLGAANISQNDKVPKKSLCFSTMVKCKRGQVNQVWHSELGVA
jgi:hypothetical protein